MEINISPTKVEAGRAAAEKATVILRSALRSKRVARFIAATGASQFDFLDFLCKSKGIDWARTEMFHLDEYIGLPATHPASFRKYLMERLVRKVRLGKTHLIEGDAPNPKTELKRIGGLISKEGIDVAFVGIGENGHLAFNDPPADFDTEKPYIIVKLDEKCRKQQIGEGWFHSIEEVPKSAISMSIKQIMKSDAIICTCPDKRKAEAVRDCLSVDASVTPMHPSSILKKHPRSYIFLDKDSASLLQR
ncbi:MAG: glucosamine-6-phosphate deaminase [Promethearchaeati archaeon SRVP18_Atabeyarchaeia-1]